MNSIGLIAPCWGSYWSKFGHQYVSMIEQLNPKPESVTLVTDLTISVPSWITVVRPKSDVAMWDWCNEAAQVSPSEWVIIAGLDDIYFPDALSNLNLNGDFLTLACTHGSEVYSVIGGYGGWCRLLSSTINNMTCGAVYRRDVFLRFPWRRSRSADAIQFLELRKANARIIIDDKPRFLHMVHSDSNTSKIGEMDHRQFAIARKLLVANRQLPERIPTRLLPSYKLL